MRQNILVLLGWTILRFTWEQIINDPAGFDPRFCDSGMWGRAAYFAEDAKYSDSYAHNPGASGEGLVRQLFLVQVAAGRAEERQSCRSIRRPSSGFDSVTCVTGGTRVFMLYDAPNTRCFPKYLVTYVRQAWSRPQ